MTAVMNVPWPALPPELAAHVDTGERGLWWSAGDAMAGMAGPAASVLACGPNSETAARAVISKLERPKGLVLAGQDHDALDRAAARLRADLPDLETRARRFDWLAGSDASPVFDAAKGPVIVTVSGAALCQSGALGLSGALKWLSALGGPGSWLVASFELPGDPAVKEALHQETMARRWRAAQPATEPACLKVWADQTCVQAWSMSGPETTPVARVDFLAPETLAAACAADGFTVHLTLGADDGHVGLAVLRTAA